MFSRETLDQNGVRYWVYTLTLRYTPKKEGDYTFGPVLFKGNTIVNVDADSRGVMQPVFAVGPAVTVRVEPPPEEGRPDTYVGAIGSQLTATAGIDVQTCRIGDPLTLTLALSGDFSLDNLRPPRLSAQEELVRHFRVYEDTIQSATKDGTRTYTYVLRPLHGGTFELPPIEIAYYNVKTRAYQTVRTEPIPIHVREGAVLEENAVLRAAPASTEPSGDADAGTPVAAPLRMFSNSAQSVPLTGGLWHVLVIVLTPALFAVIILVQRSWRNRATRRRQIRRRRALSRALKDLGRQRLRDAADGSLSRALVQALRHYLGDRTGTAAAGLTPSDAVRVLETSGVKPETIARTVAIFERNFEAAFAGDRPSGFNPRADAAELAGLLKTLDAEMKRGEADE